MIAFPWGLASFVETVGVNYNPSPLPPALGGTWWPKGVTTNFSDHGGGSDQGPDPIAPCELFSLCRKPQVPRPVRYLSHEVMVGFGWDH